MSLETKTEKAEQAKPTDEAAACPLLTSASVTFVLGYKRDAALATEPVGNLLATHRAVVVHAEKMADGLGRRSPQLKVTVGNPIFLPNSEVAFNFTATIEVKEPELIAARSRLEELILSHLRSVEVATALIRAGHIALERVIRMGLPDLPRIKAGPANQKEIVVIGQDGTLQVTVTKGVDDVRANRSLLKTAEIANACGMRISAKLKKESFDYPMLPQGATKAEWIATECSTETGKITGFLENGRLVEMKIKKTVHMLTVKHDEGPKYADAYKKSRYVKIRFKTARPGNPYQTDDPKFSIDETLEFMDQDVQKEMKFDEAQTDAKSN